MILLFDVGNTNTHLGLGNAGRVLRQVNIPTSDWFRGSRIRDQLLSFARRDSVEGVVLCSVVPRATPMVLKAAWDLWRRDVLELTPRTLRGVGIDYPRPNTIGPDRLANSVAARHYCGAPVVVVDFGTAVTFDVVNAKGDYVGGIIAPGLSAMTDYLHEKTALLPRIRIREIRSTIGRSTEQAMLVGAVHGYRGLVRELLTELRKELKARRLPVVATGGYARLMASGLREITRVEPNLTLEGLRLVWQQHAGARTRARRRN